MSNLFDTGVAQVLMEEYKTVINTQMHFNDMLMRMRTIVFSIVIAIFGGAAALIGQYPNQFISINNFPIHIAALVVFFGLMLLVAIFIMDFYYYSKMLIGAVRRGYEFDKFFKKINIYENFHLFGMSQKIRDSIGKEGKSKNLVIAFYTIIGLAGIIYLISIVFFIKPIL